MRPTQSNEKIQKDRLDRLIVLRGLTDSRERAKALILSGAVIVNGNKVDKAGTQVKTDAEIELIEASHPFVSRGGLKLEAALKNFSLNVADFVVMDVGASTGGFTHCLLKRGAARIYAVDVGYGQLAWILRQDQRVIVLERQNIRAISENLIPEKLDLVTIDVSFISLEKVIPPVLPWIKKGGALIALIKPQFEVGKGEVGKGGIVRNAENREAVVSRICGLGGFWGLELEGVIRSPIEGQKGNIEFLVYFKHVGSNAETEKIT